MAALYWKTKGGVTDAMYGERKYSAMNRTRAMFDREVRAKAKCRMSETAVSNSGYWHDDPRIGDPNYKVAAKDQVSVPPFLFTANSRLLRRPVLSRHPRFAEETPEETAEFIRDVQDMILQRGPAVAQVFEVEGQEITPYHAIVLHGWERNQKPDSSQKNFVWLLKNSWGKGGSRDDSDTSLDPGPDGYTHLEEPDMIECPGCTRLVVMEIAELTPILPPAPNVLPADSAPSRVKGGSWIMPQHSVSATVHGEGIDIQAVLGELPPAEGGSGNSTSRLASSVGGVFPWHSVLKFKVVATFTSFTTGAVEHKMTEEVNPSEESSGPWTLTRIPTTDLLGRGILAVSIAIAAKNKKFDVNQHYTTQDLFLPGDGPLFPEGEPPHVSLEAATVLRRAANTANPTLARNADGVTWKHIELSIRMPTAAASSTVRFYKDAFESRDVPLTQILSVESAPDKRWGLKTITCNGLKFVLINDKGKESHEVVCTRSEHDTGEELAAFAEMVLLAQQASATIAMQ